MDFLKILNATLSVIAWLIVLAIVWALAPWFWRILEIVQKVHDFAK